MPKQALQAKLGKYKIVDLAKEIIKISHCYLNKEGKNEQKYLDSISELIQDELCPADIILQNWHDKWNGNFSKFIQHVSE